MKKTSLLLLLALVIGTVLLLGSCGECLHSPDEGTVTKAPTCLAVGEKVYECLLCGEAMPEKTEEIAALGHEVDEDEFDYADGMH